MAAQAADTGGVAEEAPRGLTQGIGRRVSHGNLPSWRPGQVIRGRGQRGLANGSRQDKQHGLRVEVVAIRVRAGMPLHLRLQCATSPPSEPPSPQLSAPQSPDSSAHLGNLDPINHWRHVTPPCHPVPQLPEVLPHIWLELSQRLDLHAGPVRMRCVAH